MEENKDVRVKPGIAQELYDWVETFCVALTAVVLVFTFVCRFVTVDGNSMIETLHDKDRLTCSIHQKQGI